MNHTGQTPFDIFEDSGSARRDKVAKVIGAELIFKFVGTTGKLNT